MSASVSLAMLTGRNMKNGLQRPSKQFKKRLQINVKITSTETEIRSGRRSKA
jgi:hypothetical protein